MIQDLRQTLHSFNMYMAHAGDGMIMTFENVRLFANSAVNGMFFV